MRTTVTLDDDVAAEVERTRRERGVGMSRVINDLVRAGLVAPRADVQRVQLSAAALQLRIDVSNVAEALDVAEAEGYR